MEFIRLYNVAIKVADVLMKVEGVNSRVFPIATPFQTTKRPYICYSRTSYIPKDVKLHYDISRIINYTITIVASEYEESLIIADQAMTELLKMRDMIITDVSEDFEEDAFLQIINFKIEENE